MSLFDFRTSVFGRCLPVGAIEDPIQFGLNITALNGIVEFFGKYRFFNELASSFYIVRYDILILMGSALGMYLYMYGSV